MRGKYGMREWEVPHLTKIVQEAVRFCESHPGEKYDLTEINICPHNVSEILGTMGYDEEDKEDNFMDFWFIFFGPNYEDAYLYLYVSIATLEMYLLYEKQ